MKTFKVIFEDGNYLETGFNGSLEDVKAYYVGHRFNFGDIDGPDMMIKAVEVIEMV
ncbi:MAG TPA: hypothetical protein VNX68_01005 [Nitrosopumilaceae archaeon]|jgi:hypothetical protein|nr:hypothetical protein [Nitrosopumilaceae archaeon]